jgi:hypothetical protein
VVSSITPSSIFHLSSPAFAARSCSVANSLPPRSSIAPPQTPRGALQGCIPNRIARPPRPLLPLFPTLPPVRVVDCLFPLPKQNRSSLNSRGMHRALPLPFLSYIRISLVFRFGSPHLALGEHSSCIRIIGRAGLKTASSMPIPRGIGVARGTNSTSLRAPEAGHSFLEPREKSGHNSGHRRLFSQGIRCGNATASGFPVTKVVGSLPTIAVLVPRSLEACAEVLFRRGWACACVPFQGLRR